MKVAILHEGTEDNALITKLITTLELDLGRVEFYRMGSKSNFFTEDHKDYRELIQLIRADQIVRVLFVVDADFQKNDQVYGGYANTLSALKKLVVDFDIVDISQFYICCDPSTQEGNVESLLLATLDKEKKTCIDDFLACSDFNAKNNSKAILNGIYNIAYPEPPYNFKHEYFNELKEKLRILLS
uniref:DUF4276 family protein n=1 Tax=uncultured Thiotrichaceae bacterium TaxID=298394 RepID=A0A6S6S117_9GAMM|nr:MAG: Unknown protein [uncultured Thiotrichaceae bacterium]